MTDLRRGFERAVSEVQLPVIRPDNDTLLRLDALFLQGSQGADIRAHPGLLLFRGHGRA